MKILFWSTAPKKGNGQMVVREVSEKLWINADRGGGERKRMETFNQSLPRRKCIATSLIAQNAIEWNARQWWTPAGSPRPRLASTKRTRTWGTGSELPCRSETLVRQSMRPCCRSSRFNEKSYTRDPRRPNLVNDQRHRSPADTRIGTDVDFPLPSGRQALVDRPA